MREIKFRAWEKALNEMFYFDEWGFNSEYCLLRFLVQNHEEYSYGDLRCEQESSILMQFTGLKDESDKEIYDGDIIKDDEGTTYRVGWDDYGQWYAYDITNNGNWSMSLGELNKACQVVGNIYENPELLTLPL